MFYYYSTKKTMSSNLIIIVVLMIQGSKCVVILCGNRPVNGTVSFCTVGSSLEENTYNVFFKNEKTYIQNKREANWTIYNWNIHLTEMKLKTDFWIDKNPSKNRIFIIHLKLCNKYEIWKKKYGIGNLQDTVLYIYHISST